MTRLLTVEGLHAGYGEVPVLNGVSLHVDRGEIVSIVGANGAGKSTLLSAICGLLRPTAGRVEFAGADITGRPAHLGPGTGLALVPEGGRLFPFLSVEDNLLLGSYTGRDRAERGRRLDQVMEVFPILCERRGQMAGKLSGGERQMCAVARAMMSRPELMMLDEPSVGLSPLRDSLGGAGAGGDPGSYGAAGRAEHRRGSGSRRPRLCARSRHDRHVRAGGRHCRGPAGVPDLHGPVETL
jgi:branched-chain amino acid transport system ATP-binding protein